MTQATLRRVPFYDLAAATAEVRAELDRAWADTVDAGVFVGGPLVERFEHEWARYCQVAHAVGVANGTDALVLALRALGIGPGDEVVVPANTFVATAEAVVLAGATPRFADVASGTLLLDGECLAAAITPRTAAVVVVHLYGQMADMDAISAVARRAGIAVVEDCAQAHGATWNGRRAGSFGAAGCYSFYPGKNLGALGDAGAVVTRDASLAERVRSMGDHGRVAGMRDEHRAMGTNSRLDALQAAVLTAKLPRLDGWNAARRAIAGVYAERLRDGPVRPLTLAAGAVPVHHLNVVRALDRDRLRRALAARGVETRIHYPLPCHRQEAFAALDAGPLPEVECAAREIVSLPMFPQMTGTQVDLVCEAIADSYRDPS